MDEHDGHQFFAVKIRWSLPPPMRHLPSHQTPLPRRDALRSLAMLTAFAALPGSLTAQKQDVPSTPQSMMTHERLGHIFALLASDEPARFYDHVADDVHWTVLGTHPLAGSFASKAAFQQGDLRRLAALFDAPLKIHVRRVLLDGDVAVAELYSHAVTKDGLAYDNEYCWVCRFAEGKIVGVRAYVDSALVAKVVQAREANG